MIEIGNAMLVIGRAIPQATKSAQVISDHPWSCPCRARWASHALGCLSHAFHHANHA